MSGAVPNGETPNLPHLTQEERRQLRLNTTERYSKSLESLSDDATTDAELIERVREIAASQKTAFATNTVVEAADALQSRISEVERLELRAREALEGLLQIAAGVVEMGDPAYERACALFNELEERAALSQHRKV